VSCPLVERLIFTARLASEAEVLDILGILNAPDMQSMLGSCCFVASKLNILPKYGLEELNLAAVVDKHAKMETAVDNISARVEKNDYATATLASRLDSFSAAMTAQIEKLTNIGSELSLSAFSLQGHMQPHLINTGRSMNSVVFGVLKEDRDTSVWRKFVVQALEHVAGHTVETNDMFRIGLSVVGKTRPVAVKLHSSLCGDSYKLRNFIEQVFIRPHETLETRQKLMLERIKFRAEIEGKSVSVVAGVLSVDSVNVYSLGNGHISHQHD